MVAIPPRSTPTGDSTPMPSVAVAESLQAALPTMYDLPSESLEEPGLPDEFHDLQPQLLSRTLQLSGYSRDRYFTVSDLNLYYDANHPQWYKRADWFLAVNVPRLYEERDLRRSYVIWYEKQPPAVVVEFLSEGTEADDLGRFHPKAEQKQAIAPTKAITADASGTEPTAEKGTTEAATADPQPVKEPPPSKLTVYEEYLRVPHYLVYQRQTQQLRYFRLVEGRYQEQPLNPGNPQVWLEDLAVGLGIWQGVFEGAADFWLRWCDANGNWLLTDTEQERLAKEQERLAKEQERLAKEQAEQRAEQERLAKEQERRDKEQAQTQLLQAAQNLLATGMPLEQVAVILNLSDAQVQRLNDYPS